MVDAVRVVTGVFGWRARADAAADGRVPTLAKACFRSACVLRGQHASRAEWAAMDALHSTCPACDHRFVPWRVWMISRWSCMRCPACHCKLNRRFGLRDMSVCAALLVVFGAWYLNVESSPAVALVLVVGALSFYLADVCMVRLVRPGSFRIFSGYKP